MKKILLLGATGSVGTNTISVIRDNLDEFQVVGIAGGRAGTALVELAAEFPDAAVAVAEADAAGEYGERLRYVRSRGEFFHGPDAMVELVRSSDADICVAAIGGTAGLRPAFAAAEKGMRILLANKEVLVSAGGLFLDAVRAGGAEVLPLDSEHAALWQCLESRVRDDVEGVVITASGGPFRMWTPEAMRRADPEDAVRHPVWRMGAKISVDSATLANKALEVIEAQHLFSLTADMVRVLVHPQSVVHGMIEFVDGSVMAHMGIADMRQPIGYMLFYPERRAGRLPRLDLAVVGCLEFEEPDYGRFPLLGMGLEAGRRGGRFPAFYNAANEAAVELFLAGRIGFADIAVVVEAAMGRADSDGPRDVDDVLAAHDEARRAVFDHIAVKALKAF